MDVDRSRRKQDPNDRESGDFEESSRVGMIEVAKLAGVAVSSVSRVISGHPDVSVKMRRRVLAAVEELGYQPDFLAQSLRRGATLSVGFVCRDITTPLMASFAYGAEVHLRGAGYSMLLMNSEGRSETDVLHIKFFQSRRVDGMILSLSSENQAATLDLLGRLSVPAVVVDRELPARLGISAVLSAHRSGMRAAAAHLIQLGHRRIAFISGPMDVMPSRERLAGIKDALASVGSMDEVIVIEGAFSADHGEVATETLLQMKNPPTAIVTGSNSHLVGCMRSFRRNSIEIGKDVSLVSCDDVPLSELSQPPISVVDRDSHEVGRAAADLLLRRITGNEGPSTIILPTTYVARASCGPPRVRLA